MIVRPKKIYLYIARKFLVNFLLVSIAISTIILITNLFDMISRVSNDQVTWTQIVVFSTLQIPSFLESISDFLIALSAIITLFTLSLRSEITIIRASGMSLWQILAPIILSAFLLGIITVTLFNPLSIIANKQFNNMEQKFIEKEETNLLVPKNGIWLRQSNVANPGEEIIIRADKIYRKNLKLENVNLWFFDDSESFYQKIDAKTMLLENGYWQLEGVVINNKNNLNVHQKKIKVATDLKANFITKKILNNFENVALFSVYDLPSLIEDLQQSGFSPQKFIAYYHSLINRPFIFIAMVLVGAFFAVNNVRSRNNIVLFVIGVMVVLVLHIGLLIISTIGASGLIPEFLSTWITSLILLSLGMLLTFRKEAIA